MLREPNVQAVCAGKDRLQFYKELNFLAKELLVQDAADIDLNNHLFELLSRDFQLCADFKRIYVDGLRIKEQDRQFLANQLRLQSSTLALRPLQPSLSFAQSAGQHRKGFSTGSVPAQFLTGMESVPLERSWSEQSDGGASFRMRNMSLDDGSPEHKVLHYGSPEEVPQTDGGEDMDGAHLVEGHTDPEDFAMSRVPSLQHSLYRSQPGSGQQSLQQSLHGSFTGNAGGDENEHDWVCLGKSAILTEPYQTGGTTVGGVGIGDNGVLK